MLKKYYYLFFLFFFIFCNNNNKEKQKDFDPRNIYAQELIDYLQNYHYKKKILVDSVFFDKVNQNFIETIDKKKIFFLKKEINKVKNSKFSVDSIGDFIENTRKISLNRLNSYSNYSYHFLNSDNYSFKKQEYYSSNFMNSYALTEKKLEEKWRLDYKYSLLMNVINDSTEKNLKIKIKNSFSNERVRFSKLIELYQKEFTIKRIYEIYLNSICQEYDVHSNFFPEKATKSFQENISGKYEGIGASLTLNDNNNVEVTKVFPGGPAYRQGELEVKDEILQISQEATGDKWEDASGDVTRAISFIRGKKNTIVRLKVKKKKGIIKEVIIKRGTINYDFFFSKSAILEDKKNNFKVGYIKLPSFYQNFQSGDQNQENTKCSLDVKNDIILLKKSGIENIIMDLRGNGGGSLQEVVQMVNLFIGPSVVVQVRDKNGRNFSLPQKSFGLSFFEEKIFDGELVVLIDNISASASEIFAAAIQDYNRGVVVGMNSFGKGTVQNVQPLPSESYGKRNSVKCTIQKFYRVNGTTTQLKGVYPDIFLPMKNEVYNIGEKFYKNVLPSDKTAPAEYTSFSKMNEIVVLKEMSQKRIDKNIFFKTLNEMIEVIKKEKQKTKTPLYYKKLKEKNDLFKKNIEKIENKIELYKNNSFIFDKNYEIDRLQKKSMNNKELKDRISVRDEWYSELIKDPYIEEGFNILKDLKMIKEI